MRVWLSNGDDILANDIGPLKLYELLNGAQPFIWLQDWNHKSFFVRKENIVAIMQDPEGTATAI